MSGHPAVQQALRNYYFDFLGLPRLHVSCLGLTQSNRRGTDPYARWWGRGGIARCPPIPIMCQELILLATRHRLYILRTVRVEPARSIDFLWCHPARDIAHLLADVVAPDAGRKGLELGAQIDRWLSSKPSRAGFAFGRYA